MSNFDNIKKVFPTLQVWAKPYKDNQMVVLAEELEELLQSAQVVYGVPGGNWVREDDRESCDNHSALIIGITPIKKKTKAEEALELLERLESMNGIFNVAWVKDDMKRILEMKD